MSGALHFTGMDMVQVWHGYGGDMERTTENVRCRDGTAQRTGWDRSAGGRRSCAAVGAGRFAFCGMTSCGERSRDSGVIDRDAVRIRHGSSVPCQSVGTAAARMMAFVFGRL